MYDPSYKRNCVIFCTIVGVEVLLRLEPIVLLTFDNATINICICPSIDIYFVKYHTTEDNALGRLIHAQVNPGKQTVINKHELTSLV